MAHVHWWLFGLSFATGLALTLALLARPRERRVRVPESAKPTTKIPVAAEFPTTKIPVAQESPTTKIPVASPTTKIPVESPTTKIPAPQEFPTTKIPVPPSPPHGPGSAAATPDGAGAPPGWLVKGRSDTRLYYTPDDPTYDSTVAQVWFKGEESAARAGFTRWRKS